MANHGYIPRSGIVDMVQVAEAARTVYSKLDLCEPGQAERLPDQLQTSTSAVASS